MDNVKFRPTWLLGLLASFFTYILLANGHPWNVSGYDSHSITASRQSCEGQMVRYYVLEVTEKTLWTTCNPYVNAVVVNGTAPGPTLRARRGERLVVKVHNNMQTQNTTIHWHGFSMYLNPASDGTPLLSQWPIAPGHSFEYSIDIPKDSWDSVGTYFYHAHVGLQALSAHGALIVEDEVAPQRKDLVHGGKDLENRKGRSYEVSAYQYDEDRIISIMDYWGGTSAANITKGLLGSPFVFPGSAHALPINGKTTGYLCNQTALSLMMPSMSCPAPQDCNCDYPEIRVGYDQTVRFRFIGSQALMVVQIGLPDHAANSSRMGLIEADGSYLEEFHTPEIEIAPGQRYSWLIKTKSEKEVQDEGKSGIYWMRFESRWRAGPSSWLRIVYPAASDFPGHPQAPEVDGRILQHEKFGGIAPELAPLPQYTEEVPPDDAVTRTVIIDGRQIIYTLPNSKDIGVRWTQNFQLGLKNEGLYNEEEVAYTPLLVQLLEGSNDVQALVSRSESSLNETAIRCQLIDCGNAEEQTKARSHHLRQGYDNQLGMYVGMPDEIIDIVLVNRPSQVNNNTEIHPWHMHSSKHWTLAMGAGTFSFDAFEKVRGNKSVFASPIPRDTSVVYSTNTTIKDPMVDGGWTVIRHKVRADNSGIYPLHCHLHFHLALGMAVVWAMGPDEISKAAKSIRKPEASSSSTQRWNDVLGLQPDGSVEGLSSSFLRFGRDVRATALAQQFPDKALRHV